MHQSRVNISSTIFEANFNPYVGGALSVLYDSSVRISGTGGLTPIEAQTLGIAVVLVLLVPS